MRLQPVLLLGVLPFLAGCGDSPLAPDGADRTAALLSNAPPSAVTVTTPMLSIKQVSSGTVQPIGWCNEAAGVLRVSVPATGVASHTGRFEGQQTNCLDPVAGVITDGTATLTAANGDRLYMSYTGEAVPGVSPTTSELFYVVTGGTGRFSNAEGELSVLVVLTSETTWTSTGSGWIRYSASDRAQK